MGRKMEKGGMKMREEMKEGVMEESSESIQGMKQPTFRFVIIALCSTAAFLSYGSRTNINNAIISMIKPVTSDSFLKNNSNRSETSDGDDIHPELSLSNYCPVPKDLKAQSDPSINSSFLHSTPSQMHGLNVQTYEWTPTTQGLILGSFFYGYIVTQIPAGRLSEIFGGKWIVAVGIFFSGVLNILVPIIASSTPLLVTSRVFLGMVQGGIYPALFQITTSWMSKNEVSIGFGMVNVGGNLGAVFAASITGYLSQYTGWPSSFYVIGSIAICWTIFWIGIVRSHPKKVIDLEVDIGVEDCDMDEKEVALNSIKYQQMKDIELNSTDTSDEIQVVPWMAIITNKAVIGAVCARFAASYAYLSLQIKLPAYLTDILHASAAENGKLTSMLFFAISITMGTGGFMSEAIIKRNWLTRTATRRLFSGVGLYMSAACLASIPFTGCDEALAISILVLGIFAYGMSSGGDLIIPADMTKKYPATIFSIANLVANLGGASVPLVIGLILDQASDPSELKYYWDLVFYTVASIVAFFTTIFVFTASAEVQDFDNL